MKIPQLQPAIWARVSKPKQENTKEKVVSIRRRKKNATLEHIRHFGSGYMIAIFIIIKKITWNAIGHCFFFNLAGWLQQPTAQKKNYTKDLFLSKWKKDIFLPCSFSFLWLLIIYVCMRCSRGLTKGIWIQMHTAFQHKFSHFLHFDHSFYAVYIERDATKKKRSTPSPTYLSAYTFGMGRVRNFVVYFHIGLSVFKMPAVILDDSLIIVRIIRLWLSLSFCTSQRSRVVSLDFCNAWAFFIFGVWVLYSLYVSLLPYNFPLKIDTIMAIFTRKVRAMPQYFIGFFSVSFSLSLSLWNKRARFEGWRKIFVFFFTLICLRISRLWKIFRFGLFFLLLWNGNFVYLYLDKRSISASINRLNVTCLHFFGVFGILSKRYKDHHSPSKMYVGWCCLCVLGKQCPSWNVN